MNRPEDAFEMQLRVRMERLADSVSAGDGIDGAELYRQAVRRKRRRGAAASALIAAAVALVIVAAAIWLPGTIDGTEQRPSDGRPPGVEQHDTFRCARVQACFDRRESADVDWRVHLRGGAEVSHAEAERRCTAVWHHLSGPKIGRAA